MKPKYSLIVVTKPKTNVAFYFTSKFMNLCWNWMHECYFFIILINKCGNNLKNNDENYVDWILFIKSIKHFIFFISKHAKLKFLCGITLFHNEGIVEKFKMLWIWVKRLMVSEVILFFGLELKILKYVYVAGFIFTLFVFFLIDWWFKKNFYNYFCPTCWQDESCM